MIELATNKLSTLAQEALSARLYVPGWSMRWLLFHAAKGGECHYNKIAVYREDGKPVGAAIVENNNVVNVFVRKAYRRRGIGKELIEAVRDGSTKAFSGVRGSMDFFEAVGLKAGW